jgi:hypothetical protein
VGVLDREWVAATAYGWCPDIGFTAKPQDGQRAEAVRFVVEEHLVKGGEHSRGLGLVHGGRSDGVARQ